MSILDLLVGLLIFHFITFGPYLAAALVCIVPQEEQRQQQPKRAKARPQGTTSLR